MSWVLVRYRRLADTSTQHKLLQYNWILKPSSDELLREAYKLLRYNTILKPSFDEFTMFTTTFLQVSAITVRLSTSCLRISMSWAEIIGLTHKNCPHTLRKHSISGIARNVMAMSQHCKLPQLIYYMNALFARVRLFYLKPFF